MQDVIDITEPEIARIQGIMGNFPDEQKDALKPIFDALGGAYHDGILRFVKAALQHLLLKSN